MRGNIKSFEKSFTHSEVVALAERTLKRFGGDKNKAGRYARSMESRYESSKWALVVEVLATSGRHHATTKASPAQLDREIAEVLGRWEEDPFGGYRFITTSDGVRFDTAGVDPTYHRDPKWRQRWEFDLKREIDKFKDGKPTKLYKMSETHYRLPGTV